MVKARMIALCLIVTATGLSLSLPREALAKDTGKKSGGPVTKTKSVNDCASNCGSTVSDGTVKKVPGGVSSSGGAGPGGGSGSGGVAH